MKEELWQVVQIEVRSTKSLAAFEQDLLDRRHKVSSITVVTPVFHQPKSSTTHVIPFSSKRDLEVILTCPADAIAMWEYSYVNISDCIGAVILNRVDFDDLFLVPVLTIINDNHRRINKARTEWKNAVHKMHTYEYEMNLGKVDSKWKHTIEYAMQRNHRKELEKDVKRAKENFKQTVNMYPVTEEVVKKLVSFRECNMLGAPKGVNND